MMTLCTTCKLPTLCWWAFDGKGGAVYKCVSPNCGATEPGPRYPENPAMKVRVA